MYRRIYGGGPEGGPFPRGYGGAERYSLPPSYELSDEDSSETDDEVSYNIHEMPSFDGGPPRYPGPMGGGPRRPPSVMSPRMEPRFDMMGGSRQFPAMMDEFPSDRRTSGLRSGMPPFSGVPPQGGSRRRYERECEREGEGYGGFEGQDVHDHGNSNAEMAQVRQDMVGAGFDSDNSPMAMLQWVIANPGRYPSLEGCNAHQAGLHGVSYPNLVRGRPRGSRGSRGGSRGRVRRFSGRGF